MKQQYVVGFAFIGNEVVLIKKNKPEWQKGLLNGVGGKVEDDEFPNEAMAREFREETGVETTKEDWVGYCTLDGADFQVRCFFCTAKISEPRTQEEEMIYIVQVRHLEAFKCVENLTWLVHLALDVKNDLRPSYVHVSYP